MSILPETELTGIDILILEDTNGGTATLTTQSPQSHYGCPVLRIEDDDDRIDGDFGPADLIDFRSLGSGLVSAAEIVYGWAHRPGRTLEEIAAARLFLCQWPEGPQIARGES